MDIIVVSCSCPNCKAKELREDGKLNIRAFKVHSDDHWWSQCLVCAGYYDDGRDAEDESWRQKGWF